MKEKNIKNIILRKISSQLILKGEGKIVQEMTTKIGCAYYSAHKIAHILEKANILTFEKKDGRSNIIRLTKDGKLIRSSLKIIDERLKK